MVSIDDNTALLLYRVGPVLCCAPCQPISAIIIPPELTHTPGSTPGHPGIFRHANLIVQALDLRHQFGVEKSVWSQPGHNIVTAVDKSHIGFHVDEIQDVIKMPTTGWGALPPLLPRGIFSRTLFIRDKIYLYAEFAQLQHIPHSGYLRQYIEQLLAPAHQTANTNEHTASPGKAPVSTAPTAQQTAAAHTPREPTRASEPSLANRVTKPAPTKPHTPQKKPETKPVAPAVAPSSPAKTNHPASRPAPQSHLPSNAKKNTAARQHTPPATGLSSDNVSTAGIHKAQPSQASTTSSPHSAADDRFFGGLIVLLVLLGLLGAGLWYSFGDASGLSGTVQNNTSTPRPEANSSPAISAMKPDQQPAMSANKAKIPAPATQTTTSTASPAGADTNIRQNVPNPGDYHASIKKQKGQITITVDVPAPASPPQSNLANQHSATNNSAPPAHTTKSQPPTTQSGTQTAITPPGPSSPKTRVIIYTVVKGDTLWAIAKKYVQDPFRYPELARLSKIKNPNLIYPGDRVRIVKRIHQAK